MQFLTLFTLAAIATVSAAAQQVQSASEGSCSQGTPQCCSSVHDGADAQSIKSLIGLDDVAGQVGLSCVSSDLQRDLSLWFHSLGLELTPCFLLFHQNQIPVNAVGASAAISNSCKDTAG